MNPLSAINLAAPRDLPSTLGGAGQLWQALPAKELEQLAPNNDVTPARGVAPAGGSFSNVLGQLVSDVNGKQVAAGDAVNGLLSGQNASLHQTMIALEEANVSFQLMVEVRNKLLESYQELMRMQV